MHVDTCLSLFGFFFIIISSFMLSLSQRGTHHITESFNEMIYEQNPDWLFCQGVCQEYQKQAQSLLLYDPKKKMSVTPDAYNILVGYPNIKDVRRMSQLQKSFIKNFIDILENQSHFIIFFDKPEYSGKMYFIGTHQPQSWSFENQSVYDEEFNEETQKMYDHIENDLVDDKNKQAYFSGLEEKEEFSHLSLSQFVTRFQFYFGRKFSCIIPQSVKEVRIIPKKLTNMNNDPYILKPGRHGSLAYYNSFPGRIIIDIDA